LPLDLKGQMSASIPSTLRPLLEQPLFGSLGTIRPDLTGR
jgi:hypothetical protein